MNFLRLQIIPFSLLILGLSLGCRKAGFVDESGSISIVSFYRIQDERVDYLFFELQENSETLEHSSYYYAFDHGDGTFDENATWTKLSFHEGVHQHAVISCGESKRCGSFSWPSDDTRGRIAVRMVYHPEGSAKLEDASSVKNLSTLFQSARVFGVYDAANEHVQVRIEDNFGGLQASQYGMTRRFKIHAPSAFTATSQQMKELRSSLRNNYLFPASFCPDATTSAVTKDFFGSKVWLDQVFPNIVTHSGSCMNVDFVDKNGVNLATHEAYARRNPNFKSGAHRYKSPLNEAIKIPIVLAYCADAQSAGQIRNANFFDYQRSIIGFESNGEDLCFRVGGEAAFRASVSALLASKLAAAKAVSTTTQDFVFTVVFHQNLSTEFRAFHQILAEEINTIAVANDDLVSPRLSGAFIYDSRSDFRPSAVQESHMIWCPHDRPVDPSSVVTTEQANCIVTKAENLDLSVLNFVTPMGPFPALEDYVNYVDKYSDRGLAKKPELSFASVPQDGNTFRESEDNSKVTYFDTEHLIVTTNQRVKVCWDRPNSFLLYSLRFREAQQAAATQGIEIKTAEAAWSIGAGIGDYRIGLSWEYPFVGRINYKSALSGSVFSTIPFSRAFNTYQSLGDARWTAANFDLGELLQVCTAYCDHPFFDEAGTYQISVNYSDSTLKGCTSPLYPTIEEP